MINKHAFSIRQTAFPFIKKNVFIDLQTYKVRINQQSILKSDEVDIDIDRVQSNTQKIRRWAILWLFVAFALTLYFSACVSSWFWRPPITTNEMSFYIFGQILLFLGMSSSWWKFFNGSYNLTLFFDRYNNAIAFSLFTNKPDVETYHNFTENLKKVIITRDQTRSIQSILNDIPTHILVEEFSSSYIEELAKRGIDVSALLSFLQKKAINRDSL